MDGGGWGLGARVGGCTWGVLGGGGGGGAWGAGASEQGLRKVFGDFLVWGFVFDPGAW